MAWDRVSVNPFTEANHVLSLRDLALSERGTKSTLGDGRSGLGHRRRAGDSRLARQLPSELGESLGHGAAVGGPVVANTSRWTCPPDRNAHDCDRVFARHREPSGGRLQAGGYVMSRTV